MPPQHTNYMVRIQDEAFPACISEHKRLIDVNAACASAISSHGLDAEGAAMEDDEAEGDKVEGHVALARGSQRAFRACGVGRQVGGGSEDVEGSYRHKAAVRFENIEQSMEKLVATQVAGTAESGRRFPKALCKDFRPTRGHSKK